MVARFDEVFQRMNGRVALAALAWVAEGQLDQEAAEALSRFAEFEENQHTIAGYGILYWGPAQLTSALLRSAQNQWDLAEADFLGALASARCVGARPWIGYAQLAYARMLARRGDEEGASASAVLVCEASETAAELGLEYLARLATEL